MHLHAGDPHSMIEDWSKEGGIEGDAYRPCSSSRKQLGHPQKKERMACLENHSHRLNPKKWRATENAKTLRPLKDLCTHSTVQSTCVLNSCTRVITTSTTATNHPNLLRASKMTSAGTSKTFHACLLDVNNMLLPTQFTKFGSYFASLASCQCHKHYNYI